MPHDLKPVVIEIPRIDAVADRQDVQLALQAGFSGSEIVYMLDLPEDTVIECDGLVGQRRVDAE